MPPKGYRHLSLKESVYIRLVEIAKSKGFSSIGDAIVFLIDYYEKLENIINKLETLSKALETKTGANSVQKENPQISVPNTGTNIVPNTGADAKVVTKCIEKSKIKNLKAYVEHLKKRGVLVDWWEDLEDYCFELREG